MDSVAQATSKSCSKVELSEPAISRYVERDELRSVSIHNWIIQNLNAIFSRY